MDNRLVRSALGVSVAVVMASFGACSSSVTWYYSLVGSTLTITEAGAADVLTYMVAAAG